MGESLSRGARAAAALAALVAATACGDDPDVPPAQRVAERRDYELHTMPEYRARFPELMPAQQKAQLAANLARQGKIRLDDSTLIRVAALQARILAAADTTACAAIARGWAEGVDRREIGAAVAKLDREAQEAWADYPYQALMAELRQRPARTVAPEQLNEAVAAFAARYPEAEGARLRESLAQLALVPDGEACWAARELYGKLGELPEPHRSILARGIV